MDAPWKGEKVSGFIRVLSWVFIVCALFAFGWMFYFGLARGEGFSVESANTGFLEIAFGFASACYIFLLFTKVAVTGFAPKSWVPWR